MLARAALWLTAAGIFVGIGYSSYQGGSMLARSEVTALEGDVRRLTAELENLRMENDRLQTDLSRSRQGADALKRRYDADVPSGGLASLLTVLRDRRTAGVRDERLAQVLRDAENTRPCEARFTRKRFAIQTGSQGNEEGISLLEGLIQVSATAPGATDDLAKSTVVTINRAWTSQPIKVTGMPVRQPIQINNIEMKLVVEPSDLRGYATATLSLCGRG
jgi:hypothetical protein